MENNKVIPMDQEVSESTELISPIKEEVLDLINHDLSSGPYIDTKHAILGQTAVANIVNAVKTVPVMKTEDSKFLMEHSQHLGLVLEKCHMWRTDLQKRSIVNDINHPTPHSKFHQAILEQKVQFEQAMYLAKEFEEKKIEVERLELDMQDSFDQLAEMESTVIVDDEVAIEAVKNSTAYRRILLDIREKQMNIQFAQFTLQEQKVAMEYRMAEVKGWQVIEEELLAEMREAGMSDEDIWTKQTTEIQDMFFKTMYNLQGIQKTTDAGEFNNLVLLAIWSYQQAKEIGILPVLLNQADDTVMHSVQFVENYMQNNGISSKSKIKSGLSSKKIVMTDDQLSAKVSDK